jgi:hypothetical protein
VQRSVDGMSVLEVADLPAALTALGLTRQRRSASRDSD